MPLRRVGTVPSTGVRYGPGSAAHRFARAARCAASGARSHIRLPQGPAGFAQGPRDVSAGASVSLQGPDGGGNCPGSTFASVPSSTSDGSASGPGSWPPANLTSAATRESTEGGVANRSANPSRGLSGHISITAEVAPGSSPRFSILRSAEIMASGFLVSSTDPASASSSRERDSASLTTCDNSPASRINATAMMTTTIAPPPPLLSLLDDEGEDDEEDDDDHDDPPLEFQL